MPLILRIVRSAHCSLLDTCRVSQLGLHLRLTADEPVVRLPAGSQSQAHLAQPEGTSRRTVAGPEAYLCRSFEQKAFRRAQ